MANEEKNEREALGNANNSERPETPEGRTERTSTKPEQPYHAMVVELASAKALEVLRGDRWRARLEAIGLSSAAVVLLLAIGGFLSNEVLDARVSKHIEASIDEELEGSNYRMELAFLELKVERLFGTDGLTEEDLQQLVNNTRMLLNRFIKNPDVAVAVTTERAEHIRPVLAKCIELSARVGRGDFVTKCYDLAPDIVAASDEVTQTLVQHTGRRLLGESGAPEVWYNADGQPNLEYRQYMTFAERARNTGFPEVFLAFELVMRHMLDKPRDEIVGLIRDAETLSRVDLEHFDALMMTHGTEEFTSEPDASSGRVAERYIDFLEKYEKDSELIASILANVHFTNSIRNMGS